VVLSTCGGVVVVIQVATTTPKTLPARQKRAPRLPKIWASFAVKYREPGGESTTEGYR
jgi:hypothetical protein